MIAVAVAVWAGVYLLIPSLLFDKIVSHFVPPKKIARTRTDEFLYGILIVFLPIGVTLALSRFCYWFGHHPFAIPPTVCSLKWSDYHKVALALSSDSFFKDNASSVWESLGRIGYHQGRFLWWMYIFLLVEITAWTLLLGNYSRLQRFALYRRASPLLIGRVSEWHLLLTTFLFQPKESRSVYADIVTSDGLYQGKVRNYFTNNDGTLSGVLLDEARRFRKQHLEEDRKKWRDAGAKGEGPKTSAYWSKIAGGTHLYIPADQVGNLNVRYEKPALNEEADILKSLQNMEPFKTLLAKLDAKQQRITITLRSRSSEVPKQAPPSSSSPSGVSPPTQSETGDSPKE